MSALPGELWPWLALAGLGIYHGLNPSMGWLFAVALGLNRHSRRIVFLSLIPIALGHAAAVAATLAAVLALGTLVDTILLQRFAGLILIVWATRHALYGHRGRVRVGMQTGLAGLLAWSFLMAGAHGAGLMLIPAVLPLCLAASPAREITAGGAWPIALAALAVHTAAMLATIGLIATLVYEWIGVAFLRRGWVNLDLIWTLALAACGLLLIVGAG